MSETKFSKEKKRHGSCRLWFSSVSKTTPLPLSLRSLKSTLPPSSFSHSLPLPPPPLFSTLKHRRPGRALLLVRLEVLVDDRHREQDARPGPDRAHEVRHDGQRADAHPPEGRGGRDVAVELLAQGLDGVAVALEEHALLAHRLGDVVGRRARDLDPRLGEQRAGAEHEAHVEQRVHGAGRGLGERAGRGDVVDEAADGVHVRAARAALRVGPAAEEADEDVSSVALEEELGDEVEVGDERGLFVFFVFGGVGSRGLERW